MEDLVKKLKQKSGIAPEEIQTCRVIYKGKALETKQSLREAGVEDGSTIVVLTPNSEHKATEFLAIFLEMLNGAEWEKMKEKYKEAKMKNDKEEVDFEAIKEVIRGAPYIKRQDVSDAVRNILDSSYRRLRRAWEHPAFRRALHDTSKIEAYRIVIDKHLSKKILKDIPGAKSLIENSDAWRKQISKLTASILKTGDVVLDGILDVLLDVLKGAGKSKFGNEYAFSSQTDSFSSPHSQSNPVEDLMKANELLFELSESEDEN